MNDKRITIRLPASTLKVVDLLADKYHIKPSKFIRDAIENYITALNYNSIFKSYDKEEN